MSPGMHLDWRQIAEYQIDRAGPIWERASSFRCQPRATSGGAVHRPQTRPNRRKIDSCEQSSGELPDNSM